MKSNITDDKRRTTASLTERQSSYPLPDITLASLSARTGTGSGRALGYYLRTSTDGSDLLQAGLRFPLFG